MEEKALVQRSKEGDEEAFSALVNKYKTKVFRLVFSFIHDRDIADDLTQETFIKAYLALPKFRLESEFGTWLYRISLNHTKDYLRKKLGCIKKENSVYLASSKYHLRGIVDEVLFLNDGTLAPIDYKYAEYNERLYQTYKIQSVLYALLIKENFQSEVDRGYVCYVRSRNLIKELPISPNDYNHAIEIVNNILKIIQTGFYPKKTKNKSKCIDCCYKNICV